MLLGRVVAKLVFGVNTSDPSTFAAVSILLATVALMATVLPAYRATTVDPIKALRNEERFTRVVAKSDRENLSISERLIVRIWVSWGGEHGFQRTESRNRTRMCCV